MTDSLRELPSCYFYENTSIEKYEDFIDKLVSVADIRFYSKGDHLYFDTVLSEGVFLVLKGTIEAYYIENEKKRTIAMMDKGSLMGLTSLISRTKHSSVCCRSDCTVAFISNSQISNWGTDMLIPMLHIQAEKMRLVSNQMVSLAVDSIKKRLVMFLHEAAMRDLCMNRTDLPVCIKFSKQEIADLINTSREYVTATLKELQKNCRLYVDGNNIVLYPCDIEAYLQRLLY